MPLKLTCPNCGTPTRVSEPYPLPGVEIQCVGCATAMSVTYPPGVMDLLRQRGKSFMDDDPAPLPPSRHPVPDRTPVTGERRESEAGSDASAPVPTPPSVSDAPTRIDEGSPARQVELPPPGPRRRSAPSIPAFNKDNIPETPTPPAPGPERAARGTASVEIGRPRARVPGQQPSASSSYRPPSAPPPAVSSRRGRTEADAAAAPTVPNPTPTPTATMSPTPDAGAPSAPTGTRRADRSSRRKAEPPPRKGSRLLRWGTRLGCATLAALLLLAVLGGAGVGGAYWYYGKDLPSVDALQRYQPNTVTEVYDVNGVLMGELYAEERRYVVPLEEIPPVVQNAFISAEDASFREHGGVDYVGLVRAVLNEVTGGDKRQGASTITMQVTRNFLLTRDKTYERKIKEIILAQRIESVYDKDRILWLYLNEIYLGSGAYGVEAASRVYFGKHVEDLTTAEAALIAGLAPAPSTYSPHRNWTRARDRQLYVLKQMKKNGFLTDAELQSARDEHVPIVKEENPFLTTAPHFTEHVRRHLMDTYGGERVYKEGLRVYTTMDLEVQQEAQRAVVEQVHRVDQRMGFRRAGLQTLGDKAAIEARRAEHEQAMLAQNAFELDPAGRVEPEGGKSELHVGRVYDAVVLEVDKKWVRVGIGAHEGLIPIDWSGWVYEPNPRMSWRFRTARDFTTEVRGWEEGVDAGGSIIRRGDVVLVKVEALSTTDPDLPPRPEDWPEHRADPTSNDDVTQAYEGTPGADRDLVAVRLWQDPEVEAATMTFDVNTGAVRAMVGGSDFEKSEFNRATQAKRQVGSTFKPIVYSAAIDTEKLTAASIVPDVRGASYTTDAGFVWKPDNYGDEYLGNITLRKALALSKNTCTIKVLESMDPGMNDDVLYTFARKLGVGGPPSHTLPEDHVTSPENDHLCPWVRETRDSTICMDRLPPKDPDISNTRHRMQLGPDDVHMCRACDMSMGLGSASLTMAELLRAYSAFPSGGRLISPYYIERVEDRDGDVLEEYEPAEFPQVIRPEVAYIGTWLLENVVNGGTGFKARKALQMHLGGKTGTTQDFKDAWFVGFNNDVMTAAWVGFDDPRSMGVSSTGGRTALPIWIDVMRKAAPKEADRPFQPQGDIEWALIDEERGRVVTGGGRRYPFIRGTVPMSSGVAAGEISVDDITDL